MASLKIESILRETTIHRRRTRLKAMGDGLGLGEAYDTTLGRIRAQEGEKAKLAMTTLMWVCHSERPLQIDELCHALGVEIGSTDFNSDNVPAIEIVLACCQGLVTVDREASIARLTHHTLGEYLTTQRNLFPRAQLEMAETCLTYLNSDQAKALPVKPPPDLSTMPFLKYCSRYWGTHARRELSDGVRLLAMELLDQYENHVAADTLFQQILDPGDSLGVDSPSVFGGLHCASFFGIADVMTSLLGIPGCDANQGDSASITPLIWAVRGGQGAGVELLLKQEAVNPEKPDNYGRTPLSWAAIIGHQSVMKQLLDRQDVDPDRPDNMGGTPLSWAASSGNESVVKQLLDRQGVDPGRPDNEDRTPLSWAARSGYNRIVQQLLNQKEVDPGHTNNKGFTPLIEAAYGGHESVVKQLLDRLDVNPDKPDNEGRTPLLWAAMSGHESVVKQLLDRQDVNPDKPDNEGRTPLSWAAMQGHESVVKQLLDRQGVNPDKPDNEGRTPLLWAATQGHEPVVKQLLDRPDVNPGKVDNNGHTPLYCASSKGHAAVVNLLQAREPPNLAPFTVEQIRASLPPPTL